MRLKVKATFVDKYDHMTLYRAGTVVEFEDEARCADLVKRGLCEASPSPAGDEPTGAEPVKDEPKKALKKSKKS